MDTPLIRQHLVWFIISLQRTNLHNKYLFYSGWLGYTDEKMIQLCKKYQDKGFTAFKIKIGQDLKRDIERCRLMRKQIGYDQTLMVDSNQIFSVNEAIEWMIQLKDFKPLWIEEPTSPDVILGHAAIAKALKLVELYFAICFLKKIGNSKLMFQDSLLFRSTIT